MSDLKVSTVLPGNSDSECPLGNVDVSGNVDPVSLRVVSLAAGRQ